MPWSGAAGSKIFSRATGFFTGATAWQQSQSGGRNMLSLDFDTHDQDLSDGISGSLQKNGDNTLTGNIPAGGFGFTGLGVLGSASEATIASATTTDLLGSAALFNAISGVVTITSLGTGTNRFKIVRFTGILILTHNSTSLILPGGQNITTAVGDVMGVVSDGSSNARVVWYQSAGGTPGLVKLASGTVSAATLDLVLTSYTAFKGLKFVLSGFRPATDGADLYMRFSTNGGSSYLATNYKYVATESFCDAATSSIYASSSAVAAFLAKTVGSGASFGINAEVTLLNQAASAFIPRVRWGTTHLTSSGEVKDTTGSGVHTTAQDVDAVRFLFSAGNITAGNYSLYGLT